MYKVLTIHAEDQKYWLRFSVLAEDLYANKIRTKFTYYGSWFYGTEVPDRICYMVAENNENSTFATTTCLFTKIAVALLNNYDSYAE